MPDNSTETGQKKILISRTLRLSRLKIDIKSGRGSALKGIELRIIRFNKLTGLLLFAH